VDQPSGDPADEETVRDLELESLVELLLLGLEHVVELFGLDDGAWEAIEDEAAWGEDRDGVVLGTANKEQSANCRARKDNESIKVSIVKP
jgi:hypothetical protein